MAAIISFTGPSSRNDDRKKQNRNVECFLQLPNIHRYTDWYLFIFSILSFSMLIKEEKILRCWLYGADISYFKLCETHLCLILCTHMTRLPMLRKILLQLE